MLTFTGSEENQTSAFHLLGTAKTTSSVHLISDNTSLISDNTSLIFSSADVMDTCSFYNGPTDETILAFGQQSESCGSVAYSGDSESCGSVAYSGGGESCGSVASSSCGSACSYSC